jgi:prepilin-type N-terminal cleavage/methylation domain-containing protein
MKRRKKLQRQHGLTLIELLIVLGITAILASALGYAFTAELTMQRVEETRRAALDRSDTTERQITRLLQGAKLTAQAESSPAAVPGVQPGQPAAPAVPAAQTTYFAGVVESGANDLGCDRLTFTTTAPALPMAALAGTDDFETQQQARGPVGGLAEVSLSVTPVGDAGGRTGLFERLQRPSDGDPTQGGSEFLLDPQIERIGFRFWDGLQWVTSWSATAPPRLPQAVRVSYTRRGAPDEVRVFDVPLPSSDVSAQSPQNTGQNTN